MSREEEEYIVSDGMKQIPIKWTAPEALNFGLFLCFVSCLIKCNCLSYVCDYYKRWHTGNILMEFFISLHWDECASIERYEYIVFIQIFFMYMLSLIQNFLFI